MTTRRLSDDDVLEAIRSRAKIAGSLRALAREWSVSHAYISDVLRREKPPGDALLRPLGLKAVTYYERVTDEEKNADTP